ncbi:MAG: response regulator [Anaerolineae bacterium]|nr:response regulator [Anaerolineae bacterium]
MARILIAEDEPDIRDLVRFTLTFAGHEVIAVSNGAEAVEMARTEMPDMVLMDVRMPRMTGYEACAVMKSDPKTAGIPVVFLSAKGQENEIQTGLNAGADEYLLKPFAPMELSQQINELLKKYGRL